VVVYGLVQVNVPPVRQRQGAEPHHNTIPIENGNKQKMLTNLNFVASVSKPVMTAELLYIFQCLVDRLSKCFHF
jgi:hypothetical protein